MNEGEHPWIHSLRELPLLGQRCEIGVDVETLAGSERYFTEAVYWRGWGLPRGHQVVIWRPAVNDPLTRR